MPRVADSVGPFFPRALVPVTVGCSTINLYPVINGNMAMHEQAHAFHINKTALLSQYINLCIQLDALGHQLSLSATVEGIINDWLRYFYDRWCDFQALQIPSFHNTRGNEVNDMTTTADPSILLPVINGALNTCCKNVKFVRVQLSVNFVNLVTIANPGPTTLRIKYFIELPQTTHQMTNRAGNAYTLTTFTVRGASGLLPLRKSRPISLITPSRTAQSRFRPRALVPPVRKQTLLPSEMKSKRKFFASPSHPSVR